MQIVESFISTIETLQANSHKSLRFVHLDAITSNTALRLPVERLVLECNHRRIPVLVDGAHAPMSMPLKFLSESTPYTDSSAPPFFVGNMHKWMCSPKGAAFLVVRPDVFEHVKMAPLSLSHGMSNGLLSALLWSGCQSYAAQLTSGLSVLPFWLSIGMDRVSRHCHRLVIRAGVFLAKLWQTGFLRGDRIDTEALAELDQLTASMILIRIPGPPERYPTEHNELQDALYARKIEVPTKVLDGMIFVRLSAALYNNMHQYKRLGQAILELCADRAS